MSITLKHSWMTSKEMVIDHSISPPTDFQTARICRVTQNKMHTDRNPRKRHATIWTRLSYGTKIAVRLPHGCRTAKTGHMGKDWPYGCNFIMVLYIVNSQPDTWQSPLRGQWLAQHSMFQYQDYYSTIPRQYQYIYASIPTDTKTFSLTLFKRQWQYQDNIKYMEFGGVWSSGIYYYCFFFL